MAQDLVSFLKSFGQTVGKILKFVAGSAAPIAHQAAAVIPANPAVPTRPTVVVH